jgi:hypothetical protein
MSSFKTKLSEEADKQSQTYQRISRIRTIYRSHAEGFQAGSHWAVDEVIRMLRSEEFQTGSYMGEHYAELIEQQVKGGSDE